MFLDMVKKKAPDLIATVKREVDPKYELAGVVAKLEKEGRTPIVIFNKVKGTEFPVICNLVAGLRQQALSLDTTEQKMNEEFRKRESSPKPVKVVKTGPVKEVVLKGDDVDLTKFPQIWHNAKDGGPYITPGVMIVKDPETGRYNDGCYRHQIKDKNTLGIHISQTAHAFRVYTKYEDLNKPMDVAIVLGHHPAYILGSLSFVGFDVDELEIDGGIMNEPLEVVKGETVDLLVPSQAEIVIEGKIQPKVRKKEGPFGEYTRVYGPERMNPEIDVTAITMRKKPYFYDLYPGGAEHLIWGGTPRLSQIFRRISMVAPGVKDVYMPISGNCRFICYICLEKQMDTDPREAIMAAFTADPFIKYAVVVDPDINIFNEAEVLYAIANRLQPLKDVFVIPDSRGSPLDPTGEDGYTVRGKERFVVTKVGIDATKPLSGYPETISVPGIEKINLKDYL